MNQVQIPTIILFSVDLIFFDENEFFNPTLFCFI